MSKKTIDNLITQIKNLSEEDQIKIKNNLNLIKELDYEKQKIFLYIESLIELKTRTISCRKEPEIVQWIESNFKSGDVFYDIGANIGAYSLVASKFLDNKIKTYAFEPNFLNFCQLNRNIILNNCQSSIIPLSIALSDKNGIDYFNFSSLEYGAAAHAFGKARSENGKCFQPAYKQQMLSYRLDDLVEKFNIESPNYIKIDVDGIELKVLKGAKKLLKLPLLKSIVIEIVFEEDAKKFTNYLRDTGFKFSSRHPYTGVSPGFNYIFIRN